jgi:hypothetical protein
VTGARVRQLKKGWPLAKKKQGKGFVPVGIFVAKVWVKDYAKTSKGTIELKALKTIGAKTWVIATSTASIDYAPGKGGVEQATATLWGPNPLLNEEEAIYSIEPSTDGSNIAWEWIDCSSTPSQRQAGERP